MGSPPFIQFIFDDAALRRPLAAIRSKGVSIIQWLVGRRLDRRSINTGCRGYKTLGLTEQNNAHVRARPRCARDVHCKAGHRAATYIGGRHIVTYIVQLDVAL